MSPLTRYRFEFEWGEEQPMPGLGLGCGVTASTYEDALALLRARAFNDSELPPINRAIEGVDVSMLDQGHVVPNMAPPVSRGIWFPRGYS